MIRVRKKLVPEFKPASYIMDEGLKNAVEVAIALEQPLLLTGEPGTGKTRLAYKLAFELAKDLESKQLGLHFSNKPLIFNTKTTSTARDLFYTYDALGHFQAANVKQTEKSKQPETAEFIELQALGKAIAQTNPAKIKAGVFKTKVEEHPQSSVVLIDEIDKAPRDFTNDILNEIENFEFFIKEQENYRVHRGNEQRIVVIMTSNSEKNLPDAFLRRCVFYHIPFPSNHLLMEIVKSQLGKGNHYTDELLDELIQKFALIRKQAVRKPPATAELIAWLRILEAQEIFKKDAAEKSEQLRDNLSILVKTKEDLEAVRLLFGEE